MFKRSRRRIVAAIMSILVLLWVGSLGVIYSSSYLDMKRQNREMLTEHAQSHTLPPLQDGQPPHTKPPHGDEHGFDPNSPMFRLSTFYTVALSHEGDVLEVKNDPPTIYTDGELAAIALLLLADGEDFGTRDDLTFLVSDRGGYMLVSFMDNTVVNNNAMTLFRYTLIFGAVALIFLFFISVILARRIVAPLEESYRKQRQFISDAGHELKTPISIVGANAELLSREQGDSRWLDNIRYENERMGALVGQLLELARTESLSYPKTRLDFSRLVSGEALPFESVAFEKGMTLQTEITDAIELKGNEERLRQLVSILLDNAISHGKEEGQVQLVLTREHSRAVLSVINHGDEIPTAEREQLFERFYRTDPARNGEDKHYGLGLAIARAITASHKGSITVDCRDGLVEFRVRLPII